MYGYIWKRKIRSNACLINIFHLFIKRKSVTRREMQCFICQLRGRSFKEIARELNISVRT